MQLRTATALLLAQLALAEKKRTSGSEQVLWDKVQETQNHWQEQHSEEYAIQKKIGSTLLESKERNEANENKRLRWKNDKNNMLTSRPQQQLKNAQPKMKVHANPRLCNPHSMDPDLGILSCNKKEGNSHYYCQENATSFLGGICVDDKNNKKKNLQQLPHLSKMSQFGGGSGGERLKNRNPERYPQKECVPLVNLAEDPDIGILSPCRQGEHCMENASSTMGGICVSSVNHDDSRRHLQKEYFCVEMLPYYDSCDCSNVDYETGTGSLSCVKENFCFTDINGCESACATFEISYVVENSTFTTVSYCNSFTTPYQQKICYTTTTLPTTGDVYLDVAECEFSIDDTPCLCQGGFVDCSTNPAHSDVMGSFPPILQACADVCDVCGPNTRVVPYQNVTVPNYDSRSCEELANMGLYGGISEAICPTVQNFAFSTCCETYCDVCPGATYITKLDTAITVPEIGTGTCNSFYSDGIIGAISSDLCPSVQSVASETCCRIPCNICQMGFVFAYPDAVINIPAMGRDVACNELYYNTGAIPDDICLTTYEAISSVCCQARCSLCRDGSFNNAAAESIVTVPDFGQAKCFELEYLAYGGVVDCDIAYQAGYETCCYEGTGVTPQIDLEAPPEMISTETSHVDNQEEIPMATGASMAVTTSGNVLSFLGLSMALGVSFW